MTTKFGNGVGAKLAFAQGTQTTPMKQTSSSGHIRPVPPMKQISFPRAEASSAPTRHYTIELQTTELSGIIDARHIRIAGAELPHMVVRRIERVPHDAAGVVGQQMDRDRCVVRDGFDRVDVAVWRQ